MLEWGTVVVHPQEDLSGAGLAQAGLVEDPQAGFPQLDLLAQEPAVGRVVSAPLGQVVALPDQAVAQGQSKVHLVGDEADLLRAVASGPGRASAEFELVEAGKRQSVADQDVRLLTRDEPRVEHHAVRHVVVREQDHGDVGTNLHSEGVVASRGRLDVGESEDREEGDEQ